MKVSFLHKIEDVNYQFIRKEKYFGLQIKLSSVAAVIFASFTLLFRYYKSYNAMMMSFKISAISFLYSVTIPLIYLLYFKKQMKVPQETIRDSKAVLADQLALIRAKTRAVNLKTRSIGLDSKAKKEIGVKSQAKKETQEVCLTASKIQRLHDEIKHLINRAKEMIPLILEDEFDCSISFDPMKDPVIDNCGHTFDRSSIEEWMKKNNLCPINREMQITSLVSNELVKDAIHKTNGNMPFVIDIRKFKCLVTKKILNEPVVADCGHTFENKSLRINENCPIHKQPVKSLVPNLLIKSIIEKWSKKNPVPTLSKSKECSPQLFKKNLIEARQHIKNQSNDKACEAYSRAMQFTKDWRDYEEVPKFFEKIGEKDKAYLSYTLLAHYQLQDKKLKDALQTLKHCRVFGHLTAKIEHLLLTQKI